MPGRRRLLPRLLARADRPGQPRVVAHQHAEGRVGDRCRTRSPRSTAFYGALVDKVVPVGSTGRGRAREAAREHLPPRQHRARQRARDVRPRPRRRHLERDRRGGDQAASASCAFTPGPGVGGHCLPIDPSYLAWRVERRLGHRFRFVELANDVNSGMPDYVVRRVQALLNDNERAVKGSRVLLLGLAYKAGTSDWRESPATTVAQRLSELGAVVRARTTRTFPTTRVSGPRSSASTAASRSSKRPISSSCSPRTTTCPTTTSPSMRDWYWTPEVASAADRSGVRCSEPDTWSGPLDPIQNARPKKAPRTLRRAADERSAERLRTMVATTV